MIKMRFFALLLVVLQVALLPGTAAIEGPKDKTLITKPSTNGTVLVAGPNDELIARVTARMLERQHYLRKPFNDEVSSKFLDRYLDMLDGQHMYFWQSDLKQFDK